MSAKEASFASLSLLLYTFAPWAAAAEPVGAFIHVALNVRDYVRTEHHYQIPDAILTDAYGKSISLAQELEADEPVMLNFIDTRCVALCAAMSASFAEVQRELGAEMRDLRLFSITIDPEHDTPNRLFTYASQYRAGRGWTLLTGRNVEIVPVRKAFDSFRDDDANPIHVTFLRANAQGPWVRIEGVVSASQLAAEYRQLHAK